MSGPACVVFDPTLTAYDFGPTHPMSPLRVDLTIRLADELGVLEQPGGSSGGLPTVPAPMAEDDLLAAVQEPDLIGAARLESKHPHRVDKEPALGTETTPAFEGMRAPLGHIVGAAVEPPRRVWSGE